MECHVVHTSRDILHKNLKMFVEVLLRSEN